MPTNAPLRLAVDAVTDVLGGSGWTASPLAGSSGRTYLARGPSSVVVRFDARADVLRRVAALGVAPAVLGAGAVDGRTYVLQEHVDALPVSAEWLAAHSRDVAALVATYTSDAELAPLADPLPAGAYAEDLLERSAVAGLGGVRIRAVEALADASARADDGPAVATHGDPNHSNFLAADRLLLVDWDDLRRADRMRDLAQIAWWYLPEHDWPDFVEAGGGRWGASTEASLYWWVAAESLDVALRLLPTDGTAAELFLVDFEAAIGRRPNPRRHAAADAGRLDVSGDCREAPRR